jgi:drug/metabolite transporter (DMT)-like permease
VANRILTTSEGRHTGAFSAVDWSVFLGIGLIWGASFLLIEIALRSFAPGLVTWTRAGFGAATLAVLPSAGRTIDPVDRTRVVAVAALWVAIPWTLFPLAQQHVTSAVAGMLNGSLPIMAAVVGAVMLGRLPRPLQIAGLLLGAVGVAAIAVTTAGEGSSQALGVAMVLAAVVCYAFAINIVAPLQQTYGSVATMARVLAYATVMTAPFGLWSIPRSSFSWAALGAVLTLGVLGSGIAFVLMARLVGHVGTTRAAFAIYLVPVVAMFLGAVVLDEAITGLDVAGMAMVSAGAVIASRPARRAAEVT